MINRDHPVFDAAEVAPRLWIGSHPPVKGHRCGDHPVEYNADVYRDGGFDFLALCAEEYQPPASHFPGVQVCYAPFDDDPKGLDPRQTNTALDAATKTVQAHRAGRSCLVTCMAGRNRSGLVTALALAGLSGISPAQACEVVRDKRGLAALTNPSFRGILSRARLNPTSTQGAVKSCELCEGKRITRRYHEDGLCWIADCKQCNVPMVVYRQHGAMPPQRHLQHMRELLMLCARPGRAFQLDEKMSSIPDHWHAHLRQA